ncbi:hypothetical protein NC652_025953 [Populus alba x Populus x berolinensis]|nr:hypothetical protein NC652_025953 [Populus alba x Populus x berolinensis]
MGRTFNSQKCTWSLLSLPLDSNATLPYLA